MITLSSRQRVRFGFAILILLSAAHLRQVCAEETSQTNDAAVPSGSELFQREWIASDPRSHGGDGLGPVFNDSSCVACHNQGGSGGGGPASKNVDIITAFVNPTQTQQARQQSTSQTVSAFVVNALVQAVGPNSGTRLLNTPPENNNFEINISSDMPQQCDNPSRSSNDATAASSAKPATKPSSSTAASDTKKPASPTASATASAPDTTQPKPEEKLAEIKRQRAELAKIHPGFASARSVVLHRFSTNEKYEPWRMQMLGLGQMIDANASESTDFAISELNSPPSAEQSSKSTASPTAEIQVTSDVESAQKMQQLKTQAQISHAQGLQGRMGNFTFVHSRRNPTALFGAGLIDQIPDRVLIEQAQRQFKDFPEIQGRVAKTKDGKIGRFGWKDQKPSLYEFSMTACAVELGLDVPDQPQSGLPLDPSYKPKGHDMDQPECDALVAYLSNLPRPIQRKAASPQEAEILSAGEKQFAAVGCANCHAAKLGSVTGIYSDLLLHDMGPELGDSGDYGVFVPDTPEEQQQDEPVPSLTQTQQQASFFGAPPANRELTKVEREKTIGALRQEWRTPPLWGVRDSGPYLHDGRAETLEQAIAFHGGESANSAKQFFMLKPEQRAQVITFLKSLVAPEQLASAQ